MINQTRTYTSSVAIPPLPTTITRLASANLFWNTWKNNNTILI